MMQDVARFLLNPETLSREVLSRDVLTTALTLCSQLLELLESCRSPSFNVSSESPSGVSSSFSSGLARSRISLNSGSRPISRSSLSSISSSRNTPLPLIASHPVVVPVDIAEIEAPQSCPASRPATANSPKRPRTSPNRPRTSLPITPARGALHLRPSLPSSLPLALPRSFPVPSSPHSSANQMAGFIARRGSTPLVLKRQAVTLHYKLARALVALAEAERECEHELENRQMAYLRQAKSVLSSVKTPQEEERRTYEIAEGMHIWDENPEGNQVNPVNLLFFFADAQFEAAIGSILAPQSETRDGTQDAWSLGVLQEWAAALTAWGKWQHESVQFARPHPHTPRKEDERQYLSLYELYIRAALAFERCLAGVPCARVPEDGKVAEEEREQRRALLLQWAGAIDGLVSIKLQQKVVDANRGFNIVEGEPPRVTAVPFAELLDRFLAPYQEHLLTETSRDSLRPLVALSLNRAPVIRTRVMKVCRALARTAASAEIKAQARHTMDMAVRIAEAESQGQITWLTRQLHIVRLRGVNLDTKFFTPRRVHSNITVFRNALLFRYGLLLPSNLHQSLPENGSQAEEPITALSSMQEHLRRQSRRRRISTIARVIAQKLQRANDIIVDTEFAALITKRDVHSVYRDMKVIGQGGFGEVFYAEEREGNPPQLVALKKISLNQPLRDLKKEIRTLVACKHPNIVRYISTLESGRHLWVAMEYCDGGTLERLREENKLQEGVIAYISRQVLRGLAYLHDKLGKVHRDIKPENIFLHLDGQVKIGDLGFCIDTGYGTRHIRNSVAGTARYLAPEMIAKEGYSSKLDIWSFACLVYFMVEGRDLNGDLPSLNAMFRVATCPPPSLLHPSRHSPALCDFLSHCFVRDPTRRWPAKRLLTHTFVADAQCVSMPKLRELFRHVFVGRALALAGLV